MRGNSIKYVTIPDEVLDMVQEEDLSKESEYALDDVAVGTPRAFYGVTPLPSIDTAVLQTFDVESTSGRDAPRECPLRGMWLVYAAMLSSVLDVDLYSIHSAPPRSQCGFDL